MHCQNHWDNPSTPLEVLIHQEVLVRGKGSLHFKLANDNQSDPLPTVIHFCLRQTLTMRLLDGADVVLFAHLADYQARLIHIEDSLWTNVQFIAFLPRL